MTHGNERRLIWLGGAQGGLGWLKQRIDGNLQGQRRSAIYHASLDISGLELGKLVNRGVDRIVLACSDRLSYPRSLATFLQTHCPDVPFALACDNWWDGSRRTGLGPIGHLQLPWYRWWDGWFDWLTGEAAELLGPMPSVWRTTRVSHWPSLSPCAGLVVGDCYQSRQAWTEAAKQLGSGVRTCSSRACQRQVEQDPQWLADFQWVLWDDSCLSTAQNPRVAEASIADFFSSVSRVSPKTVGIVGLGLPRVDLLESLGGGVELIAKPCEAAALARLLHTRLAAASSAALPRT